MKKVINGFHSNWRRIVGVLFVFAVFVMPGSKSIFAKFFDMNVHAGGSNHGHHNHSDRSRSYSSRSVSSPQSNPTASPMSNTNSSGYPCASHDGRHTHPRPR